EAPEVLIAVVDVVVGHRAARRQRSEERLCDKPLGVARGLGYHTPVMRFRRVTLLVAIYLALDFATPLMPGAVQWIDGSLEADAGVFARSAKEPAPAVAPLPSHLSTVVPSRKRALTTGPVIPASPPAPILFRAPVRPRTTAASSPDDD